MTRIARPADALDFVARAIFILANRGAMEQGVLLDMLAGPRATAEMVNAVHGKISAAVKLVYRPDGTPFYVLPEFYNVLVDGSEIRYHQDAPDAAPIAIVDNTRILQPAIV